MKLARKLILAIVITVALVLVAAAKLGVEREIHLFETDMRRDHQLMGKRIAAAVVANWRIDGEERALGLIRSADEGETVVRMRWVWTDSPPGDDTAPRLARSALETLGGSEIRSFVNDADGQDGALVTYVPVRVGASRTGGLELSESLSDEHRYVGTSLVRAEITTAVLALVCGLVTVAFGVTFVGRPMRALVEQARRVGAGDFSGRLKLRQRDEIGELAEEMNAMCQQLEEANSRVESETARRIATLEQLRHADRLTTVGKLASGVAHELGTPLNVVSGRAKIIARGGAPPAECAEGARIIAEQADRMTKIIRQLLDFARRRSAQKTTADLRSILERTVALLTPLAEKHRVAMKLDSNGCQATAHVDASQIQQVVTNLVVNGIQAMDRGGELSVGLAEERAQAPADRGGAIVDCVCIQVRDEGMGIRPGVLEHIFEPFFTTKDVGEGTGLGLSVSYGIVKEHGGWLGVESELGKGTLFTVYLPKTEAA